MMKWRIFLVLLFTSLLKYAPAQDFVVLNWGNSPVYTFEPDSVEHPFNFEGASFVDGDPFPRYTQTIKLGSNYNGEAVDVSVEYPEFEPLPEWQQQRLASDSLALPAEMLLEHDIRYASGEAYLVIRLLPMACRNGQNSRVNSFRLQFALRAGQQLKAAKMAVESYPTSSVLASGRWVKIAVADRGVYSISNSTLSSMGFSDPSRVAVYGYGGNLLQEDFSLDYCSDLPEVPVRLTSNALLFYAEGNLRIDAASDSNGDYWEPVTNYCSDYGYYFLTEKDSPLTIQDAAELEAEDDEVTTFTEYIYYKGDELFAWSDFGRRLYDSYDFKNGRSQSYSFTLTGHVTSSPVRINVAFATERSSTASALDIYANGELLGSSTSMRSTSTSSYIKALRTATTLTWDEGTSSSLEITLEHTTTGTMSGHLEYILLNYQRTLEMTSSTLLFSNFNAEGNVTYRISNVDSSTEVWDVTTPGEYRRMPLAINGTDGVFTDDETGVRHYVAVKTTGTLNDGITFAGEIENQDLHSLGDVDMVILIPANGNLYATAEELAQWHRDNDGLDVVTINAGQVYNEFSSGTPDVTAYRRLMKMLYDRADDKTKTKYLLLFGDCAFDNRMRTSTWSAYTPEQFLLSYQPFESENEQVNFLTDDYFGFLDDDEGTNISSALNTVDIGIGRLPVRTVSEASGVVAKLIAYMRNTENGSWKNNICWVADDNLDDGGTIHMEQSNELIDSLEARHEGYLCERLFLDLYKRESSSTGYSYPQVEERLQEVFDEGALVLSYIGHSNTDFWSSKKILTANEVSQLSSTRLPLWVTASCDYSRFDAFNSSAGEIAMLNANGAAVGLITTTRVVYISSNQRIYLKYNKYLYERKSDGTHYTLGEIQMKTKQARALSGSQNRNDLNFILLGDPALRLAYPDANKVVVDSINGVAAGEEVQMKAGSVATVKGHIESLDGTKLTGFDGKIETIAMDSYKLVTTLNNAGYEYTTGPDTIQFLARTNTLFMGNDSVKGGEFSLQFAVPLDINYSNESGLLNFYAYNDSIEANAEFDDFIVGGVVDSINTDGVGPEIYAYLNTPDFVYGGKVNESPVLYASLYDTDGINISDSGIGHNIVAIIDDDPDMTYSLNSYYTQSDSYMSGNVVYKFSDLPEGQHTMKLRAWDIFNNSSSIILEFEVVNGLKPSTFEVTCISPATNETTFFITHDRPDSEVDIVLEIYNFSGSLIYRRQTSGNSDTGIYTFTWNLRDSTGAQLDSGVYIYKVAMSADSGDYESAAGKIVVIRQ